MKQILAYVSILVLLIGCAKKVSPILDSELPQKEKPVEALVEEEKIIQSSDIELVESVDNAGEIDKKIEFDEPQNSVDSKLDYDQLFPDSVWTEYMTKRGDYLSLIAYKEYNNANEWRRIYKWNKEHWEEKGIGPNSDNPNLIYPYRELDLKKPANNAIEWAFDHYNYLVKSGETLWTIAQKEYGDELAWVVLFWDNEELLNRQDGKLIPGMNLKVRSQLWPDVE